jgi:hypothetical protein
MDEAGNLNHTKWECKYHVVFIAKWRRKVLYGELRRYPRNKISASRDPRGRIARPTQEIRSATNRTMRDKNLTAS